MPRDPVEVYRTIASWWGVVDGRLAYIGAIDMTELEVVAHVEKRFPGRTATFVQEINP